MTSQSLLPKIILRSSSDLVAWDNQQKNTFLEKMLIYPGEIISDCLGHVGQEVKESLEAEVNYEFLITSRDSYDFYEPIQGVINASGNAKIVVMRI